jgi:hypothetical protein
MNEQEARRKIVDEALSWRGTPWHHEARVKGGGVDCGMLLLEVFEKAGLIPHIQPAHYGPDFMLHKGDEWFALYVLKYADEVKACPDRPVYFPVVIGITGYQGYLGFLYHCIHHLPVTGCLKL